MLSDTRHTHLRDPLTGCLEKKKVKMPLHIHSKKRKCQLPYHTTYRMTLHLRLLSVRQSEPSKEQKVTYETIEVTSAGQGTQASKLCWSKHQLQ